MKLTIAIATACALLSASAFAQAQNSPQGQTLPQTTGVAPITGTTAAISTSDFVNKMIMGDMFDVQSARLAQQKGDRSDKNFAQRDVTNHTKITDDLKAMVSAGKVNATIPTAMDSEHQQRLSELAKLSGKQFDSAYSKDEMRNHDNLVALLDQYSQRGDNSALKQWASKTLPEVKQQTTNAQKLN